MKQQKALAILKSGRNVFLTGSAGAGKTYVLNQYIKYLRERRVKVAVTASTGIAATHMSGMTIHAWSGIGVKDHLLQSDFKRLSAKEHFRKKMKGVNVLIIDEISMLHKKQVGMVNQVLQYFKQNDKPFGGIQVIFSGDFFQLPPVGNQGETNRQKFAFMSKAWVEANLAICYLSEQHRQTENDLNQILNEIRSSKLTDKSIQLLKAAQHTEIESIDPPKLYSHNLDVNRINQRHLNALHTKSKTYYAKCAGNPKLIESLKRASNAVEILVLKIGAKVMFTKNNFDLGYVNGTLGMVVDFNEKNAPVVETINGERLTVGSDVWSIDDEKGSPIASITQIPLKLSWALTVHKSQGMTIDAAEIDLSKTFEKGQGYVALSRLKSLEGLRLLGFNSTALQVAPLASKADKRFKELAIEAEVEQSDKELLAAATTFILNCGGITSAKDIEKHKRRKKEKARYGKKSTYLITREYLDKGLSLEKIADQRGLAEGTIMGHLFEIKNLFPDMDLERFRPSEKLLQRVKGQMEKVEATNPDGTVSLKALFESMNEEVGYQEIKLAMVFI